MTNIEFTKMIDEVRKDQDELLKTKGADYTQLNNDRLSNFKDVASLIGLDPLQVWAIYWLKHVFAICTYVKVRKLESESLESRFFDEMNYSLLGLGLIREVIPVGGFDEINEDDIFPGKTKTLIPDPPSNNRMKFHQT